RAILCYLVEKYAKDDSLYPKDLKKRTVINHRLYFDIGTLYQSFLDYYCAVFETGKYGEPSKLEILKGSFKVLDNYLDGSAWASGNELSVADYTIAATVASCEVRCF
ncbi:Glutathione S-transferase D6, partial [Blattella germanica]